ERATQTEQKAQSLQKAQHVSQRAANHQTTASTPPTVAYPSHQRSDPSPQPAAKTGGAAGGQSEHPAPAGKAVTQLPDSTEAVSPSASESAKAARGLCPKAGKRACHV